MTEFLAHLLFPIDEAQRFFTLLILGFVVAYTPLRYPFTWLETFFHEFSHGLAAALTFGKIHRIQVLFNGAGKCFTSGGWSLPILFAGYAGAVGWGTLLYYAGWRATNEHALLIHALLCGMMVLVTLLWVRDLRTMLIMAFITLIFAFPLMFAEVAIAHVLLQFAGLYVLLSALRAPLALIDGKQVGDGAELQKRTLLHEYIWIFLWVALAILALGYVANGTLTGDWQVG